MDGNSNIRPEFAGKFFLLLAIGLLSLLWAAEPAIRVIWDAPGANVLGAPTLDGKLVTCVDPESGNLAVLETATGKLRRLTEKGPAAAGEFAYFSVPSRDGGQVAYAWFNEKGFYELRVTSTTGGQSAPRVLFRNEEVGFVQPTSWSPDGKSILTLFFRKDNVSQIALVGAGDGSVRVLKSLNWVYPKRMDISPDGRWIAYDSFAGDKPGPRDIYLLAMDGSAENKLTDTTADDLFPVWSPDGREVFFASDRSGTMDAWAVRVEGGRAAGEPRVVRKDLKQFLPMGVTARGDLFFGLRTGSTDIALIELDDAPGAEPRRIDTRTPGRNLAPAWSSDGKYLAYLSRRGAENFGLQSRTIVVRDLGNGLERDVPARLAHIENLRWSPDSEWLLAPGSDGKGRLGLFRVRVKDGFVRPGPIGSAASDYHGRPGAWQPDGEVVTTAEGGAIAVSSDGQRSASTQGAKVFVAGKHPRTWPLDGVKWLEWVNDGRLLAASAGHPHELSEEHGVRQLTWKGYDGGPFSVHPNGHTVAIGVGRTQLEIRVLEQALPPRVVH